MYISGESEKTNWRHCASLFTTQEPKLFNLSKSPSANMAAKWDYNVKIVTIIIRIVLSKEMRLVGNFNLFDVLFATQIHILFTSEVCHLLFVWATPLMQPNKAQTIFFV